MTNCPGLIEVTALPPPRRCRSTRAPLESAVGWLEQHAHLVLAFIARRRFPDDLLPACLIFKLLKIADSLGLPSGHQPMITSLADGCEVLVVCHPPVHDHGGVLLLAQALFQHSEHVGNGGRITAIAGEDFMGYTSPTN